MIIQLSQISLQLYSLRKIRDPDRVLAAAASAGYRAVELLEPDLAVPHRTIGRLAAHGLVAPSAHIGLRTLQSRLHQTLEACCEIGIADLIISSVPRWRHYAGENYWRRVGTRLTDLASQIRESTGVRLGYHNHGWEFRSLPNGGTPVQSLFEDDKERTLRWQLDMGWLLNAGQDLSQWLEFGHGRIDSIHVRDANPYFALHWLMCIRAGVDRMIVELDDPPQPEAMCRRTLETLLELPFPPSNACRS